MHNKNMTIRGNSCSGFTLIELFITITVLGIIASFAVPNFGVFIDEQRMDSNRRSFASNFSLAQSESVKASTPVTICIASTSGTSCDTSGEATWNQGWHIFVDNNGNQVIDPAAPPVPADLVLKTQSPIPSVSFSLPSSLNAITYSSEGQIISPADTVEFSLCSHDADNLTCSDPDAASGGVTILVSGQIVMVQE